MPPPFVFVPVVKCKLPLAPSATAQRSQGVAPKQSKVPKLLPSKPMLGEKSGKGEKKLTRSMKPRKEDDPMLVADFSELKSL